MDCSGRNGAGKTTLFSCLNEDYSVDNGKFYLKDNDGSNKNILEDDIGFVPTNPIVPSFLTGREFLRFFIDINKDKIKDLKTEDEYLDLINIAPNDRSKLINDYSLGMKNKIQLLVNIMFNSKILLLDEPLTSIDVVASEEMKKILKKIKETKIIIVSTHIMDLAVDLCDEIILLNNGVIEPVDRENLNDSSFKQKIIEALTKEE